MAASTVPIHLQLYRKQKIPTSPLERVADAVPSCPLTSVVFPVCCEYDQPERPHEIVYFAGKVAVKQ